MPKVIIRQTAPVPCDDAEITVNGAPFASVPSGDTLDIPVTDTNGNPVGLDLGGIVQIDDCTVLTTIGGVVAGILAQQAYNLPQSVIKYKDTANADAVTAASNTDFDDAVNLNPAIQIPRRELHQG